jgi:hypothetical protein
MPLYASSTAPIPPARTAPTHPFTASQLVPCALFGGRKGNVQGALSTLFDPLVLVVPVAEAAVTTDEPRPPIPVTVVEGTDDAELFVVAATLVTMVPPIVEPVVVTVAPVNWAVMSGEMRVRRRVRIVRGER